MDPTPREYLPAGLALLAIVAMVLQPVAVLEASVAGLHLWWEIVVPSLLPFFIGAEVLVGLGVVHAMGVLMEPLMRPLFNIPGSGSFVLAMGLASGYPIGSVLTSRLRRDDLCTKTEAERLMSFANTADPLFMSGAVAAGMFRLPVLALPIMIGHYASTLVLGFMLRFYRRSPVEAAGTGLYLPSLRQALRALAVARRADNRPIGSILGTAVRNSMNTLLLIGGFIMLFSVVSRLLTMLGVVPLVGILLRPLGIPAELAGAITSGILEITLGVQQASQAPIDIYACVITAGAIIAWSGLSVHGQVAAIIQGTDISVLPYIVSRLIHALLAAVATAVSLRFMAPIPVTPAVIPVITWVDRLQAAGRLMGLSLGVWLALAIAVVLYALIAGRRTTGC